MIDAKIAEELRQRERKEIYRGSAVAEELFEPEIEALVTELMVRMNEREHLIEEFVSLQKRITRTLDKTA